MESQPPTEGEPQTLICQQEALADLGRQALETDDIDQLMHDATVAVAETLGAELCTTLELLPGEDEVRLRQGVGWDDGQVGTATVPTDHDSQIGYTLRSEEPVIVEDLPTEDRFSGPELLTNHDVVSGISVVIGSVEEPWGVLGAYTTERREFHEHDAHFAQSIANILASAIENHRTKRNLAEEKALREQVVETSPIGISVVDTDGELRFANERAGEIVGRPPEELTSMSYDDPEWDPVTPDGESVEIDDAQFQEVIETGEPVYGDEFGVRRPDDERVWISTNAAPLRTDDGGVDGAVFAFEDVTEERRLERELNEVLDRVTDAVYALDEEWRFTYVNDRAASFLDHSEDELTGEVLWEVFPDAVGSDLYDEFHEAMETQDPVSFERHSEPLGIWAQVHAYPSETGLSVYFRDITERKETELKLRESEAKFRQMAEHLDQVVWMTTDDQLEVLYANSAFEEVWGRDREELYENAEVLLDAVHPEDREMVLEELDKVVTDEYEIEYRIVRPDGEVRWIHDRATPIYDDDGEVYRIVGDATDITDRKERELELKRYERIVETVGDAIYVVDENQHFTTVNQAAVELSGHSRERLLGTHVSDMIGEEDAAQAAELGEMLSVDGDEIASAQFTLSTADGREVPIETRFTALPTADGRAQRVGVARDISEQKKRERKLQESERRYRTLVEHFPNGSVGLFNEDLEYTAVGGQLVDYLGVDPEDRIGHSILELYPDDLVEEVEPYFWAALDGEPNSFEAELHDRHLLAHTVPVRNSDGGIYAGMLVVQDITDRKEMEQDLRESEAKFRMLAENLEEIVWMAGPDAEEWLYINPAFEEVWDRDREELYEVPQAFLKWIHPEDRERIRERFTEFPDSEMDEEFRIIRPDDEVRWISVRGSEVRDDDSGMIRTIGIGQDITDRKEDERALQESEQRYRTLAERFPNGAVGVYDRDLRYTLAAGEKVGDPLPSAEEVEGTRVPDVYPDDIAADLEPLFRATIEDGETGSTQIEVAGSQWQVWTTPLRNVDGEIFAGLSFAQDITEQIERELELERALDLLERTERIADVGGWEIDPDTQDVFWTDHIFELLEVDSEEEPPLDEALDMYHEADKPVVEDAVDDALATGDPFDVEVRIRTDSGEIRWLRLQGVPEVVDGEVVSFRGAAQDVTERKQREQRLEELVDKLEESNERLEQFAYAASHDLQEPLRMVSSYLQLIENRYADELDEDGREFIEFAVDGANRMRDMIEGLLKYSRVDTRGDPFEPVDLDDVLADVRQDLQVKIEESDAEITAEDLPRVYGDGSQLNQVFQNLLDNAIEYSGDAPPRVRVSAEQADIGDEWIISVSDEGIGIDLADADKVFEVFESIHGHDDAGTGIGLALVERIVERHGGDVWVDSEPGNGATFSFTLPAAGETDE